MGTNISVINKTDCVINTAMSVGATYYWQKNVKPGEAMTSTGVGHVWFTISASAWSGDRNPSIRQPELFTNLDGEDFTLIHDFGLRGRHDNLLRVPFPESPIVSNLTMEERMMVENRDLDNIEYDRPFYMYSPGWYVNWSPVVRFEIVGGPHCELLAEPYLWQSHTYTRIIQVYDSKKGLQGFSVNKIYPF